MNNNQFDEDEFDQDGFNKERIHKVTGTEYDPDEYNKNGWNKHGINREGFNIREKHSKNAKPDEVQNIKIKETLSKKGFLVHYEDSCHLIARETKSKQIIYISKEHISSKNKLAVNISELDGFLHKLKIFAMEHPFNWKPVEGTREGALTDYGWHIDNSESDRRESLKIKIKVEGIRSCTAVLLSVRGVNRWQSNKIYEKFNNIQNDIAWIESHYSGNIEDVEKKRLNTKFTKLLSIHQYLNEFNKPHKMIALNMNQ